ncbi:MAG: hypothetical protein HQK54_09195 [Oligoflexales bacterium]|nr:hypothetical protein [Oligoflexales bacterium]
MLSRIIILVILVLSFIVIGCNSQSGFNSAGTKKDARTQPEQAGAQESQSPAVADPSGSPSENPSAPSLGWEVEKSAAEQAGGAQPAQPSSPQAGDPAASGGSAPSLAAATSAATPSASPSAEVANAVKECLSKWGDNPFNESQKNSPRILSLSDSGQLNNTVIFNHNEQSASAQLYVVNFDIRIGNTGSMELLDKNGWYCIYVTAKVANNFTVKHQCGNKVAVVSQTAQNLHNFQVVPVECP